MRIVVVDPGHGPRSQIAEALLAAELTGAADVISAGTTSGDELAGVAEVLEEIGLRWQPDRRELAGIASPPPDVLIAVCEEGCPACPYLPGSRRVVRWPFAEPPPAGAPDRLASLRAIRDGLAAHVRAWVADRPAAN
jgi:protein-tyrosine-phosphatase